MCVLDWFKLSERGAWLIDWLIDWLSEWVSECVRKWSSISLILKPDKTKGSCCLSQNLNRETQIKFSPSFFVIFFNERMPTHKQMSSFLHKSFVTLASPVAGDSGAQVPWFDLSIFPTAHMSLNISGPRLLIPCPNPHIGHSNKSVVKNWC